MSIKKWLTRAGSLLVMLGFVLPVFSVSCSGISALSQSFSLYQIASMVGIPFLYLVPIGVLAVLILAFIPSRTSTQVLSLYFGQVAGLVISILSLLYPIISFRSGIDLPGLQATPEIGLFVIIVGYILVIWGLIDQIPDIRAARSGYAPGMAQPPPAEYYPQTYEQPQDVYTPPPTLGPNGTLQVIQGELQGSNVPIRVAKFRIGRGSDNELVISNDKTVSRNHVHIRYAEGLWFIQDQGSTSGTLVNNQRISSQRLYSGDEIVTGDQVFVFREG